MRTACSGRALALALTTLVIASACWTLRAQDRPEDSQRTAAEPFPGAAAAPTARAPRPPVQEALRRVHPLPFAEDTALAAVAAHFRRVLAAPVVLDLGALKRQGLTPETTVRLELDGVRLQTGLKLLLDQVGLTYRVVPEDNLLILTDAAGSDDISAQILDELKALHRDVHDLQDAVEEIYQELVPEGEDGVATPIPTLVTGGSGRSRPASR